MKNIANALLIITLALVFSASFALEAKGAFASASASASSSTSSSTSSASALSGSSASAQASAGNGSSSSVTDSSEAAIPKEKATKDSEPTDTWVDNTQIAQSDSQVKPENETANTNEVIGSLEKTDAKISALISKIEMLESRQVKILNLFIINFIALGIILALEIILLVRQSR